MRPRGEQICSVLFCIRATPLGQSVNCSHHKNNRVYEKIDSEPDESKSNSKNR